MKPVFADAPEGIYNPALPSFGRGEGATLIAEIIANALKVIFAISGVILMAMIIFSGIQWMTAGGDKEALANAKKRLTSAFIGFIIFVSVFAIINFIAPFLGLGFLQILKIDWPTP
ncbi:MAG TPA: pilin [Nevskiaceae bacterium]|nr:pilin [Nevskiaceae bacterium]